MMKIFGLTLLLLLCSISAEAMDLTLLTSAEVSAEKVLLKDLLSKADAARLSKIASEVVLFQAPALGLKRKVNRETIARLVKRQLPHESLRLLGAQKVQIRRRGQWVEPLEVETLLNDYLAGVEAQLPGVHLNFLKISSPPRFMVPMGQLDYQIIPANPGVIGSRRMTLITRVDGQVVENRSIQVNLSARAEVVVVTADLRRGAILTPAMLSLQTVEISHLKTPFFAIDTLLNKRLKRAIRAGKPLERHQVEFPPLIKRGAKVTIEARARGLLLKTAGEARQNGELGETIRVRNLRSHREVLCTVVAADLVRVEF